MKLSLFFLVTYVLPVVSSSVVKQWSIGGKLAFLGAMREECLKDGNECLQGFTIGLWIDTESSDSTKSQRAPISDETDIEKKYITSYLLANGGQSSHSNGFYLRRLRWPDTKYEVGVANRYRKWKAYFFLRGNQTIHVVFSWHADVGLAVFVDGLLAAGQVDPQVRKYKGRENSTNDPHPYLVANGDSLLFSQLFNAKTFLPAIERQGQVINVTYYHEWKSEGAIGEMTLDYDDRLVAGCFYEIPFGGELVSSLTNISGELLFTRKQQVKLAYFQCRNDCVSKKSPEEPWKSWMAIVDPRTFNCFCMLAEIEEEESGPSFKESSCHNSLKQTKAQFSTVALMIPYEEPEEVEVEEMPNNKTVPFAFSLKVPSMTCFFVVNGHFGTYREAQAACTRRGAEMANLTDEMDEHYIQSQIDWSPITGKLDTWKTYLLWVDSGAECNTCENKTIEKCSFITNSHWNKSDCIEVAVSNDTSHLKIDNAVGVVCKKVAFDIPTDPVVGKGFCGVPAVSTHSTNIFIANGEVLKKFHVIPGKLSWDDAAETCKISEFEGRLASIRSPEENNAVQEHLREMWSGRSNIHAMEPVWIGAKRIAPHRPNFVWPDGTPVVFTAWVIGEPNNAIDKKIPDGRKGEQCVGIWPNWSSGDMARSWNDFYCFENRTMNFGALCESF